MQIQFAMMMVATFSSTQEDQNSLAELSQMNIVMDKMNISTTHTTTIEFISFELVWFVRGDQFTSLGS